jgi:hypothetical protein
VNNSRIYRYQAYTLVDITNTGITRFSASNEVARNQQRNWETVTQIFGLRNQLLRLAQFNPTVQDVGLFNFGINYKETHKIWQCEFEVEYKDIYRIDEDPVGVLIKDFYQVPFVGNLTETATFAKNVFCTSGNDKNIYFNFLG